MNIKAINRETRKIKNAVSASLKKLNEFIWQTDCDGLEGQERQDVEIAIRASERLKCIKRILDMR